MEGEDIELVERDVMPVPLNNLLLKASERCCPPAGRNRDGWKYRD
ncbi:hypothetical protein [Novibacillus thermophilus]|nr:hypothetical protein [Novibacillus thermophilus]